MQNSNYIIEESEGVRFIRFKRLIEAGFPHHAFSTRIGGISPEPYNSMNLGFTVRDEESNLIQNRQIFMKAIGQGDLEIRQLIQLVHGNEVITTGELNGSGVPPEADGIITDEFNIPLVSTYADCIPIIMADPVTGACGVVHAGWRGTFAGIAQRAAEKFKNAFNSNPSDIIACICPGIGACCFETGEDVAGVFLDKYYIWKDLASKVSNREGWKIDLSELNKRLLIQGGLHKDNIIQADTCTKCRDDLFFSYRRDGQASGRMAAIITRR
jgi:YfiH family protein